MDLDARINSLRFIQAEHLGLKPSLGDMSIWQAAQEGKPKKKKRLKKGEKRKKKKEKRKGERKEKKKEK